MSIAILLLAAGGSTRMRGGDKLLETLNGESLLARSARVALGSRAKSVTVVLGANRSARESILADLPVRGVVNENWQDGMGRSIAVGATALAPDTSGVIIMPGDMPDLTSALLDALILALPPQAPDVILRPRTLQGIPGNPVLFGAAHLPSLAALTGDEGARQVIAANRENLHYVEGADEAVLTDLDTPESWVAYRSRPDPGKGINPIEIETMQPVTDNGRVRYERPTE